MKLLPLFLRRIFIPKIIFVWFDLTKQFKRMLLRDIIPLVPLGYATCCIFLSNLYFFTLLLVIITSHPGHQNTNWTSHQKLFIWQLFLYWNQKLLKPATVVNFQWDMTSTDSFLRRKGPKVFHVCLERLWQTALTSLLVVCLRCQWSG